jgi:mono/diheme cytochrome c family protein
MSIGGPLIISLAIVAVLGAAPESEKTAAGAFSEAQASRGEQAYGADCASCHGSDLRGRGQAPPLVGSEFLENWSGPLLDLIDRVQLTMPADKPGQLPQSRTRDIVAFLLKANGLPSGANDLPADPDALKALHFEKGAK